MELLKVCTLLLSFCRAGLASPVNVSERQLTDLLGGIYPSQITPFVETNPGYHDGLIGNSDATSHSKPTVLPPSMSDDFRSSSTKSFMIVQSTFVFSSSASPSTAEGSTQPTNIVPAFLADDSKPAPWKLVGILAIVVTSLTAMILSIVFFDQWTGFLKDMISAWKTKEDSGSEDFLPDWEKRSWEFKPNDGDGLRHMSAGSVDSIWGSKRNDAAEGNEDQISWRPFPRRPEPVLTPISLTHVSPDVPSIPQCADRE